MRGFCHKKSPTPSTPLTPAGLDEYRSIEIFEGTARH